MSRNSHSAETHPQQEAPPSFLDTAEAALQPASETSEYALQPASRPLKIMMLYQDFGVQGGIERYLLQLARLLQEQAGFEPVVACTEGGPLYRQLQAAGVTVYGLPHRPVFAKSFLRSLDVWSIGRAYRALKRERPDVAHVHIGLQENLLLKRLGIPVVYTFHGYNTLFSMVNAQNPLKFAFKAFTRWCFRQTARHMDALLVVSHTERQRLRDEGYLSPEIPAGVLYNGMPIEAWRAKVHAADATALRRMWGIPEGAPCVAFFNRLDFNKCPLDFVALARRLTALAQAEGSPLPHFLMAGDGPLDAEVRAASSDLANFRVLGLYPHIPDLLAVADLVVHPASREAFGLGVVESMAAGVPVLAYDCGGPREILDTPETAHLLVPLNDVEALAGQARRLLLAPADEKTALQATLRRRAEDFGMARFSEGMMQVYRHLLPRVSVILPVYNGADTILRAVRSVLNQTHQNLELIVVDDGSTDATRALLESISDERLRVLSQANQGVATARNLAFRHATGEWIGFIDADDVWLPDKLYAELQTARRHTTPEFPACLIYSGYFAVNERDALIHQPPVPALGGDLSQAVLEHEGLFLPSTSLVHRQVFEAVGGFRPDCYHEDRVFFIEACRRFPAFSTGQRLTLYRQSLSGRCRSVLKDYGQALRAELSIVDTLRPVLSAPEIARLADLQRRNLLYRFLMYNYLPHAQRLLAEMRTHGLSSGMPPESLLQGNKGRLAKMSLALGINFMAAARLFIQGITQTLVSPFWQRRIQPFSAAVPDTKDIR